MKHLYMNLFIVTFNGHRYNHYIHYFYVEAYEMIVDRVENACLYCGIDPSIDAALHFIQSADWGQAYPLSLSDGNVTVNCVSYTTRPESQSKKESHLLFADIHVCLEGVEVLGYSPVDTLTAVTEYDAATDKTFYEGQMNSIRLLPGMFAVTMPQDAHSGMSADGEPAPAKKLVIKCRLSVQENNVK